MTPSNRSLLIALVTATIGLVVTGVVVADQHVPGWDGDLAGTLNDGPAWTAHMLWPVMQLGALLGALAVAAVATYYAGVRRGAAVMASALLAWILAELVKALIERGRPANYLGGIDIRDGTGRGFGFASGHTAVAFAVATALMPVLPRRGRVVAYVLAAVVAVARIVHGVHFPLDTIGGACIGIASGCAVELTMRELSPDRSAEATPPQ
jgi:undecaprenyl-diphosphatase